MSRALRRRLPRPAVRAAAAVLVHVAVLLPLAVGPLAPVASAAPSPAPAGPDDVCGLTLLARTESGPRSDLLVSLPERLSRVGVPAAAFALDQAGRDVPLSVERRRAREQAVAVVLASSARTSQARYAGARGAALELLVGLRPGTRTAVGSTRRARPLAELSTDRARSTSSLRTARRGEGVTAVEAVDRAARDLPRGADVVLLSDDSNEGSVAEVRALVERLQERDVRVTRVAYAGSPDTALHGEWSRSPSQRACALSTAEASLVRQVDLAQAGIRSQHRVSAVLHRDAPAVLSVRSGRTTSSAEVPVAPSTSALAGLDPYGQDGLPPSTSSALYTLAGGLTVGGLVLVVRPRRQRALLEGRDPASSAGADSGPRP